MAYKTLNTTRKKKKIGLQTEKREKKEKSPRHELLAAKGFFFFLEKMVFFCRSCIHWTLHLREQQTVYLTPTNTSKLGPVLDLVVPRSSGRTASQRCRPIIRWRGIAGCTTAAAIARCRARGVLVSTALLRRCCGRRRRPLVKPTLQTRGILKR